MGAPPVLPPPPALSRLQPQPNPNHTTSQTTRLPFSPSFPLSPIPSLIPPFHFFSDALLFFPRRVSDVKKKKIEFNQQWYKHTHERCRQYVKVLNSSKTSSSISSRNLLYPRPTSLTSPFPSSASSSSLAAGLSQEGSGGHM